MRHFGDLITDLPSGRMVRRMAGLRIRGIDHRCFFAGLGRQAPFIDQKCFPAAMLQTALALCVWPMGHWWNSPTLATEIDEDYSSRLSAFINPLLSLRRRDEPRRFFNG